MVHDDIVRMNKNRVENIQMRITYYTKLNGSHLIEIQNKSKNRVKSEV